MSSWTSRRLAARLEDRTGYIAHASTVASPSDLIFYIASGGSDTIATAAHGQTVGTAFATFAAAFKHAKNEVRFTDRLSRITFSFGPGAWGILSIGSNLKQGEEFIPFTVHITSTDLGDYADFDGITCGSWHPCEVYVQDVMIGYAAVTRRNAMVIHDVQVKSYPSTTYLLRAAFGGKMNVFGDIDFTEAVSYSTAPFYLQDGGYLSLEAGDVPAIYPGVTFTNAANVTSSVKWRVVGQSNLYCVQAISDLMTWATAYHCDASSVCTLTASAIALGSNTGEGGPIVDTSGLGTGTGYFLRADGYLEQWGTITITSLAASTESADQAITPAFTMAHASYALTASVNNSQLTLAVLTGSTTTTACNLRARNINTTTAQSGTVRWRLWGKIA